MKKILVVDDEKNIQVSLASILEDEGYQVFFAGDGPEALEKFSLVRPDAVFLDIWLPGMDGIEVLKRMLALEPLQVVIMMSGHGSINAAVSAVKAGAYDFLEKPLSLDKVVFVLQRSLEYQQVLEENRKLKMMLRRESEELSPAEKKELARKPTAGFMIDECSGDLLRRQKTVRNSGIFYGLGLHSGEKTGMAVNPLPAGQGIRFENISEAGFIPATIEYLRSTGYATSLVRNSMEARTIEHLMSALHAFGITNLAVKINREVPIDDGSAIQFCHFIRECGVQEQDETIGELCVDQVLLLGEEGPDSKYIKIEPHDLLAIDYTCIYPEPLGRQTYSFTMQGPEDFEREIAPARTYGFVQELNKLVEMGLAAGGRINNFIMIDNGRIINTELRFPEELARHKILDLIGDLYLLGRPLRARITAQMTGHTENAAMVRLLKEKYLKSN